MGTFGSDAACCPVGLDELCSAEIPRIGLVIIPHSTAIARLSIINTPKSMDGSALKGIISTFGSTATQTYAHSKLTNAGTPRRMILRGRVRGRSEGFVLHDRITKIDRAAATS